MNNDDHISLDDQILIALQFLPEKEMPAAMAHTAACDVCRGDIAKIQGDLASFALTAELHSPPAYAGERLLRQIAREKKLINIRSGGHAMSDGAGGFQPVEPGLVVMKQPSRLWPWAGWAVAAGMAAIAALQYSQRQHAQSELDAQLRQVTTQSARAQDVLQTLTDSRALQVGIHLTSAEAASAAKNAPEAHAAYMADRGQLVFFASHLQPLQAYKTYELWLLPANGHEPIAAGLFKPDANGNANVMLPNLPKGVPASGFGVTVEDEAGAKQPTPPVLMSGS